MHGVVWGAATLSIAIIAPLGGLGYAGQWCWIKENFAWARLLFFYLPLILVLALHMATHVLVRRRLALLQRAATGEATGGAVLSALSQRFRNYALVFAVVFGFQLLNRIQNFAAPDNPSFVLYLLQSLFGPLQGLGNAAVYGWTPRVRSLYHRQCPYLCACLLPTDGAVDHGEGHSSVSIGTTPAIIKSASEICLSESMGSTASVSGRKLSKKLGELDRACLTDSMNSTSANMVSGEGVIGSVDVTTSAYETGMPSTPIRLCRLSEVDSPARGA